MRQARERELDLHVLLRLFDLGGCLFRGDRSGCLEHGSGASRELVTRGCHGNLGLTRGSGSGEEHCGRAQKMWKPFTPSQDDSILSEPRCSYSRRQEAGLLPRCACSL